MNNQGLKFNKPNVGSVFLFEKNYYMIIMQWLFLLFKEAK